MNYSAHHQPSTFGHVSASQIRFWDTWTTVTLNDSFQTAAWEHIAVTRAGWLDVRVYRNGTLIRDEAYHKWEIRTDRIGGVSGSNWTGYEGQAADIRIWNYARSQAEIQATMNQRLAGNEPGLIAYWRLDDGEGSKTYNSVTNAGHGTLDGATWTTATGLTLNDSAVGFLPFAPFTLAATNTGDTGYTYSTTVDVPDFPVPDGYDRWQITASGEVSAVNPGAWSNTASPPARTTFAPPATDTNVTLYAWFTNTTLDVRLRRGRADIVYTTVSPTLPPAQQRETGGFSVRITPAELAAAASSGTFGGEPIGIYGVGATCAQDGTPGDSFVTITNTGVFTLNVSVTNAAGRVASGTCTVTVSAMSDPPVGDRHVALGNAFAAPPHDSWTNAAATIQEGIDAASSGHTVLVAPGRYTAGAATRIAQISNKDLVLRAAKGSEQTLIDGDNTQQGVYISGSGYATTLDGFTIANCVAADGGAIRFASGNSLTVNHCILENNAATGSGSAFYTYTTMGLWMSDTIVSNRSSSAVAGIDNTVGGAMTVWNSIVYDNYRLGVTAADNYTSGQVAFTNSCIDPITAFPTAASNLNTNPLFADPSAGNYRLTANSPCLNAGRFHSWMPGAIDLDGRPRLDPFFQEVDMGAYEHIFQGTTITIR